MEKEHPIVVAKFGGSSLGTSSLMLNCARIVNERPNVRLVVLSATAGTTDLLLKIARFANSDRQLDAQNLLTQVRTKHIKMAEELNCESEGLNEILEILHEAEQLTQERFLQDKSDLEVQDQLLSIGERLSSQLFREALREEGTAGNVLDVRQILYTSNDFGEASPLTPTIKAQAEKLMLPRLLKGELLITQGFIGATPKGQTTTLGRGGSDYTAALLAEALQLSYIEIWTDVTGIASADPRIVPEAHSLKEISFAEAAELATFGAKVLHPSTLCPAIRNNIPVYIGSSLSPERTGTWVTREVEEYPDVRAITVRRSQVLVTVYSLSMLGRPGFLANVFSTLEEHDISVDLVTTSEVRVSLTLDEPQKLNQNILVALRKFAHVEVERGLALIAIIGNRATSTPGIAKLTFETIKPNIRLICHGASPHNLCFLVDDTVSIETTRILHKELIEGGVLCK